jgi:hypothetical protein
VFTSLSDAIRKWEETGTSKARNDLSFNVMATVLKWSNPKASKGVNSTIIFAQETNMWFKGSDIHVAATLLSNERDRRIYASFFFDRNKCPKSISVGEKVRLIGTRLQMFHGDLQLTGKNIQFGQSSVFMSLTDAIGAWEHVKRVQPILFLSRLPLGAEHHFPRLTMIVTVKKWGNATTTPGAKLHVIASMLYKILKRCQVATLTLQLSFHAHPMQISQSEDLSFLNRSCNHEHFLLEMSLSFTTYRCKNGMHRRNCREEMWKSVSMRLQPQACINPESYDEKHTVNIFLISIVDLE